MNRLTIQNFRDAGWFVINGETVVKGGLKSAASAKKWVEKNYIVYEILQVID